MMELDVSLAVILSLLMLQVSLTSIWLSFTSTAEMLKYAREQRDKIVFSDYLISRYGVYDEHCRSVIPQTIGKLSEGLPYNVSIRKINEPSNASGIVVRRLVFVGERRKENERVLEIW